MWKKQKLTLPSSAGTRVNFAGGTPWGVISADSTDAINGSQLYAVMTEILKKIGG